MKKKDHEANKRKKLWIYCKNHIRGTSVLLCVAFVLLEDVQLPLASFEFVHSENKYTCTDCIFSIVIRDCSQQQFLIF